MPVNGNVRLSKGALQQERANTPPDSDRSTPDNEKPQNGTNQAEEILPPFPVLLRWLEFYHTQTGNWPHPEALEETVPFNPAEKPLLTLLPTPAYFNAGVGGHDQKQTVSRKGRSKGASGNFIEKETIKPVSNKGEEILFKLAAAYNLKTSVYYHTALDLIQTQTALYAQSLLVSEETTLTLASFLAWCRLPASRNGIKGQSTGMEMYLSLDRWSRLLKMRKATLGRCLKELAGLNLVEIVDADNHVSDFSNTARKGNRVYRLMVALQQPLPVFDPLQDSTGITSLNGQEPSDVNGEPLVNRFRVLETGSELELQAEPVDMSHANNKNYKEFNAKKHEHEVLVETGTGDLVSEKFRFLLEVASFPGYASPEGRITLAEKEAHKFAVESRLDLFSIKKIYQHVLATWSAGKCTKNPLGLFHYSLTRHLKQPLTGVTSLPGNSLPAQVVDAAGTGSLQKKTSSSRSQASLHKYKKVNTFSSVNRDQQNHFTNTSEQEDQFEEMVESAPSYSQAETITDLNRTQINTGLQKQVIEALHNRFRQSALADTLRQFEWVYSISENKVRLELQNSGSNFLAVSNLGQGELSLIKIALSQGLRALTGKSLEIEVSFAG